MTARSRVQAAILRQERHLALAGGNL